jgi:excisionase family DNA binding protein
LNGANPSLRQRTKTMRLLTVKDLSELLKIKAKTLYQWAELNQIPHMKLNGALRFDYDDIMAWVKVCKRETASRYNQTIQAGGSERRAE